MTLADYLPVLDALRPTTTSAAAAHEALATIIDRTRRIGAALDAYESKTATVVAVPFVEVLATTALIDTFVATYLPELAYPAELFTVARDIQHALYSLHALRLAFASQATATGGVQNVFIPGPAPLIPYQLRQGDSLERLAQRYLGNIERSWDLVDLNGLVYPFLDTARDFSPSQFRSDEFSEEFRTDIEPDRTGVPAGVAVTGETIWLPSDAAVPPRDVATRTDRDVELFGRDLLLAGGLLVFSGTGDLVTVEGVDNVVQALRNRLATMRGELLLHPDYGMERGLALGIEGTRTNAIIAGLETARTVRQDPRVAAVRNLEVVLHDTINRAGMTVDLIGGRDVPLNLVLPESTQIS